MTRVKNWLLLAIRFVRDIVLAVLGPAILDFPISNFATRSLPVRQALLVTDLVTSLIAFALGFLFFRMRRPPTSKWIWIPGVLWLAQGIISTGGHLPLWEISAGSSVFPDPVSFSNWATYTQPLLRTVFYSVGAVCSSRTNQPYQPQKREAG